MKLNKMITFKWTLLIFSVLGKTKFVVEMKFWVVRKVNGLVLLKKGPI